ncbi:MAG: hypothetical protein N4Q38_01845 [Lactobacillus iners]|nr:hypothetical protein [Lactobacillus iners]
MKNAHILPPLFMWKEREFIMGNNNLKEKIKNARKSGGKGKFKNLYWWVIDLENEVDIYKTKYNKIFLMPYTFGLTEDDLNPNTSTDIIGLKNYEENDEEGNNLFNRISKQKNYKKAKIHSNNYNVDITTGNFHPHDALKGVIKGEKIKQIMLVRNTLSKNQSHYGVLYPKNCPKGEEKNFIILRDEANKLRYIPKKCIKLVKENEELEKTLNDFLNSIRVE